MSTDIKFEIGGRYRNRSGWYEVLEISGDSIQIRYEKDGREQAVDIKTQKRIIENILIEEESISPHNDVSLNRRYFMTLGYISRHGFVEAIIPLKSKNGFDRNYFQIKACHPSSDLPGYYLHTDPFVDKWGVEMRLTFDIPKSISLSDLDFGGPFRPVDSPELGKLRINNNELCYKLLKLGFELGGSQNIQEIEMNIPEGYRLDFRKGLVID